MHPLSKPITLHIFQNGVNELVIFTVADLADPSVIWLQVHYITNRWKREIDGEGWRVQHTIDHFCTLMVYSWCFQECLAALQSGKAALHTWLMWSHDSMEQCSAMVSAVISSACLKESVENGNVNRVVVLCGLHFLMCLSWHMLFNIIQLGSNACLVQPCIISSIEFQSTLQFRYYWSFFPVLLSARC